MSENYKILDIVNSPADLKGLTKNEISSPIRRTKGIYY